MQNLAMKTTSLVFRAASLDLELVMIVSCSSSCLVIIRQVSSSPFLFSGILRKNIGLFHVHSESLILSYLNILLLLVLP